MSRKWAERRTAFYNGFYQTCGELSSSFSNLSCALSFHSSFIQETLLCKGMELSAKCIKLGNQSFSICSLVKNTKFKNLMLLKAHDSGYVLTLETDTLGLNPSFCHSILGQVTLALVRHLQNGVVMVPIILRMKWIYLLYKNS